MTVSPAVLSLDVPCDRRAPGVVRRALAGSHQLDNGLRDDSVLVASELVANAVLHSGGDSYHMLRVSAHLDDDCLLISVHDPGLSGRRAAPRAAELPQPGGWGLQIVEQLARRWGTERPDGYRVWAELALPSA